MTGGSQTQKDAQYCTVFLRPILHLQFYLGGTDSSEPCVFSLCKANGGAIYFLVHAERLLHSGLFRSSSDVIGRQFDRGAVSAIPRHTQ
jgi:hypothetical protein